MVIGPESTGKSTLSEALAKKLNTVWVPEYARQYCENLGRPYIPEDLPVIGKGQIESEETLEKSANRFLICDTDLYVIKVWSEHAFGTCDTEILKTIAIRNYNLYLLTCVDIPWQEDPLREHPEEAMRQYFFHQYKDIVCNSGLPWEIISGQPEERLQKALSAVKKHLT